MAPFIIIWDFDGTLLPSDPYDSEHTLLFRNITVIDNGVSPIKRIVGRIIIFLDMKKWMGPAFKTYYAWVLSGTPVNRLDAVSMVLAQKISAEDRTSIRQLHNAGHILMIISCGTLDLIEQILTLAGIMDCFSRIDGNRLLLAKDRIVGIEKRIIYPADKLKPLKEQGIDPNRVVAVGDGYTDLPLLDWASYPVLMNRSGKKDSRLAERRYHEIASVPELIGFMDRLSVAKERSYD